MSVPLTILGLLEREPSHGYDLKRGYDTYFGRGKQARLTEPAALVNQGEMNGLVAGDPGAVGEQVCAAKAAR